MKFLAALLALLAYPSHAEADTYQTVMDDLSAARSARCAASGELEDLNERRPAAPNAPGGTEWMVKTSKLSTQVELLDGKIKALRKSRRQMEANDPALVKAPFEKTSVKCELVKPGSMLCDGEYFYQNKGGQVIESSAKAAKRAVPGLEKDDGKKAALDVH